ncbi:MAG: carboxyltransferase [Lactobacillaceae bacterium]|jgi:acetyl-CoA carboxylase carboxyl transferase subunit alpha|nr:carboxyltransferase [Lactobacillaceae bacterium]
MNELLNKLRNTNRFNARDFIDNNVYDFIQFKTKESHPSVIGGVGQLKDFPIAIIANFRGTNITERIATNFGMATSTGYRSALEMLNQAKKQKLPVITFIEMSGADPSMQSENDQQSQAIANFLNAMGQYPYLNIATILSEGHSGGALAFANANYLLMLEDAIFNVASPEAAVSILKNKYSVEQLTDILPMRANQLKQIGVADFIIAQVDDKKAQSQLISDRIIEIIKDNSFEQDFVSHRFDKLKKI